ncbi:MAG: penicillin-binding transpeptidase domain-containing protein [Bacteroidota bacterium]|jgi:penicillin-binding protein 2
MINNQLENRKFIITGIVLFVAFLFSGRLIYMQLSTDKYEVKARNSGRKFKTDIPPRGFIFDRHDKPLVINDMAYDLVVTPRDAKNCDSAALCRILGIDMEIYSKKMHKAWVYSPRRESVFEKQISAETYAKLQEILHYRLPGFEIVKNPVRNYPRKIAAHLLGYTGEVSQAKAEKDAYYRQGDYIGISGIEASYEKELRGKKGTRIVVVDRFNKEKGSFKEGKYDTIGVPGKGLYCTLDADLQEYGEQLMSNKKGSIVAIEPSTGEILAMVSSPSYDPNLFVGRARSKNYPALIKDTVNVPLFNRALMASYPPGSIFKLIGALVGQQEGVLHSSTHYPCAGGYPPLGGKPKCHGHPGVDLLGAIQYSCNSYFSYLFRSIVDKRGFKKFEDGYENWRRHILSFGVGRHLNTDLPHELIGNVPSVKYYNRIFGEGGWRSNTVISLGIGQAELGILPVQMANVMCIIANRGYYYIPHVIRKVQGDKAFESKWKEKHYCSVDSVYFQPVIDGMLRVVESGTARSAKLSDITICGKTGTAQNPHGKDHAVFVCFAPKENPKIALAVLVENAGFGGTWAAPIASLMIEKYINGSVSRKEMESNMIKADLIRNINLVKDPQH